jgi:hypothetical protein
MANLALCQTQVDGGAGALRTHQYETAEIA